MVHVWVAGRNVRSPCYSRAVSDFSLLSCVTACVFYVVERYYLIDIKRRLLLLLLLLLLLFSLPTHPQWAGDIRILIY